jgi:hypothetical protein
MRTISFSVSDEFYAEGWELAMACGMNSNRCSRLASLAFASILGAPELVKVSSVPPIIVRPRSIEQRRFYEAYSAVKAHASLESFALNAMERIWTKDGVTERQRCEMSHLLGYLLDKPTL